MRIARSLERRLERLLEGTTGRVFSGRIHPAEMAGRIAREADLGVYQHAAGPATANRYILSVNERDMELDPSQLESSLEEVLSEHAAEEGLRLDGPPRVEIVTSSGVSPGQFNCELEVSSGPLPPWSRLVSSAESFGVGHNRAFLGRSEHSDVVIPILEISRRHALLWREHGDVWIRDLKSANGTHVDGAQLGADPISVTTGAVVNMAGHRFRFEGG